MGAAAARHKGDAERDNGAGVLTPKSRQRENERCRAEQQQQQQQQRQQQQQQRQQQQAPNHGPLALASSASANLALGAATHDGLNQLQMQAASYDPRGALVIFAPAGAGKTLTLVHRVFHLCSAGGLQPSQVLCLTFTRKAAVEIRGRLQRSADMVDVECATFHGWCLRLLRTFAHLTKRRSDFRLATSAQELGILKEAVVAWQRQQGQHAGVDEAEAEAEAAARGGAQTPGSAAPTPHGSYMLPSGLTARRATDATTVLSKKLQRAFKEAKLLGSQTGAQTSAIIMSEMGQYVHAQYDERMRRAGLVDLSDLQLIAIELLGHPVVLESLRRRYRHLLVVRRQRSTPPHAAATPAARFEPSLRALTHALLRLRTSRRRRMSIRIRMRSSFRLSSLCSGR